MRGPADLAPLVQALRDPIRSFVREARVRIALLVTGSGQVLAQHGFTRSYEVVNVASLAAAAHASTRLLAEVTGAGRWTHLHHAGQRRQLFLAPLRIPSEELILVAIFDEDSSLGLVRLFFDRLVDDVARLPAFQRMVPATDVRHFERDLEAGARGALAPDPFAED